MARIKLYTRNALEDGTVTVTGTPDTGYPEARLYDRAISFYWKDTVTEAKTFHVDQGASGGEAVDALIIDKHNFNGEDMTWQYSTNDADWTNAVTPWTQGDNNQIVKTLSTALTKRYWRVTVTSMENPQCSEIFMSYGYEFMVDFVENPQAGDEPNVVWEQSVGGLERSTKLGGARKIRTYALFLENNNDDRITLTDFRAALADLDEYAYPFYFKDHEGNYWLARILSLSRESFISEGHVQRTLEVIEIL